MNQQRQNLNWKNLALIFLIIIVISNILWFLAWRKSNSTTQNPNCPTCPRQTNKNIPSPAGSTPSPTTTSGRSSDGTSDADTSTNTDSNADTGEPQEDVLLPPLPPKD